MNKLVITSITVFVFTLLFISCKNDDYLDEISKDKLSAENLFVDKEGFENGLNALYSLVRLERNRLFDIERGGSGSINIENIANNYSQVATDNSFIIHVSNFNRPLYSWGSYLNSNDSQLRVLFQWLYKIINTTNLMVARAENPEINWTKEQKSQLIAEVRTIRAWAYRHVTYLWGDAPFSLEEASGLNIKTDWDRTPKETIWQSMKQDWLFAEKNLSEINSHPGKVSKAVAQHYLAELYLQLNKPDSAEIMAKKVIESGKYSLITQRFGVKKDNPGVPFIDMFQDGNVLRTQGNTETLWAFVHQSDVVGGGGSYQRYMWVNRYNMIPGLAVTSEYGGRGVGRCGITRWALNLLN